MAQTERDQVSVRSLLANNADGDISPTDLRDALASAMGYGGMILTIAGKPATISDVSTTPVLVDVFNLVSAQSSAVNTGGTAAELSPTYSLTVGPTGIYHIEFWASFSTSANNHLVAFTPFINDSIGIVAVDRWIGTNTDTGVVSFQGIIPYAAGDVIDMRVAVDSGTIDLTFLAAGFNIFRVG